MGLRGALRRSGICVVPGGVNIEGVLTADNVIGSQGKTIYMDPTQSSGFTGRTPGTACKTIHEGYAKLTADQNDTLVYLVGATSATVTDTLEWAKDYTHFFGKGVVLRNQSRARIFNSGNTTGSYNLFKVSAKGCAFSNLRFFQGSAIATAFGVEVSGDWNSFDYCTFQGMGNATPAGNATNYSLKLTGADMCEFRNCTIGGSSTLRTADNAQLTFASYASQLLFKDCWILSYAQTNTYPIVRFAANNSGANLIEFEDCTFYLQQARTAEQAMVGGTDITSGFIKNCKFFNADAAAEFIDFSGTNTGIMRDCVFSSIDAAGAISDGFVNSGFLAMNCWVSGEAQGWGIIGGGNAIAA